MRPPSSLQGRLLALLLGVVSVVWLGAAIATWVDARHELDELLDSHLAQAAALLVARQARGTDHDEDLVDAPVLHRYAPRVAFQVWHEGRLVTRSPNAPQQPMSRSIGGYETLSIGGDTWRVFAAHGAEQDIQVYVAEETEARSAILRAVMRSMLGPMMLALPLLAVAGWWAVRQGLVPLRRLSGQVAQRDPQALQPLALVDPPAEMAPLIAALNGLFERIATLLESERRFTADAAHELRTPVAAIRTQAQVALGATNDAARRHALQATLEGCDRATRLVEQLLMLSRLESLPESVTTVVDLSALTRRIAAELASAAIAKAQSLELDAPTVCAAHGDETLAAVLVRNLVDNAIRYSPAQAVVHLRVAEDAGQIVLTAEDSGPGLSATELARLGERFFRVLGTGQSGSGLGWSIIRRIAAVQGAKIAVDRSPSLGGLRVHVTWPSGS